MDANVAKRMLRGLGANAYGQIVTVIVQLVGVPVLLHAWGPQLYGEWLILFAIPAYLAMTDLGFSQSAANDMTARVARGDYKGALAVFQSLAALVYGIVGAGLVLTAALFWRLPLYDWLHFQVMDADAARWVLWLLSAQVFATLPDGITHAGFRAAGEYALHRSLDATARLLQFFGVWAAAIAGGGPVVAAAIFLGVRAIATAAFALLLTRRHCWLRIGLAHARHAELWRLFRPALANMAIPLAQALNIQGMVLIVGAILGPIAVVVFSTLRTLSRLALQLVLTVAHAAEPELAAAFGAGDGALMRSLFVHALRGGLWLALLAAVSLALFGSSILEVWTDGKVEIHPMLYAWLLGSAVACVLWYGALTVLKAANRHLYAALLYVLASAVAVAVGALLLSLTGNLANAGLALLIMDGAMALYTLHTATRMLSTKLVACLMSAGDPRPLITFISLKAHLRWP